MAGVDNETKRRVVEFWRALEYLNISPVAEPDSKYNVKDIETDADWPWLQPAYHTVFGENSKQTVWFHIVYICVCKADPIVRHIFSIFNEVPNELGRALPSGHVACAALVVDGNGVPVGFSAEEESEDDGDSDGEGGDEEGDGAEAADGGRGPMFKADRVAVSALPWALGKLAVMARTQTSSLGSFDNDVDALRAAIESDFAGKGGKSGQESGAGELSMKTVSAMTVRIFKEFGWEPKNGYVKARTKSVKRTVEPGRPIRPVEPDLINSFLLDDLTTAVGEIGKGNGGVGSALDRYLASKLRTDDTARQDIIANPRIIENLVAPGLMTPGAWPAKGGYPLVLAQQAAVNTVDKELVTQDGIFSVNGPPGTGKTTMLRDIIATVIVRRAEVLAGLANVDAAFEGDKRRVGDRAYVRPLRASLKGWEMVVASSNNGAVENITKELPTRKEIDPKWLDESILPLNEVEHFREVAEVLLAKDATGDDGEDGAADSRDAVGSGDGEPAWALLGAVLGNSRNRWRFARRFWMGSQKGARKEPTMPSVVKAIQAKDGKSYAAFKDAQSRFCEAMQRFDRCKAATVDLARLAKEADEWRSRIAADESRLRDLSRRSADLSKRLDELKDELAAAGERKERLVVSAKATGAAVDARNAHVAHGDADTVLKSAEGALDKARKSRERWEEDLKAAQDQDQRTERAIQRHDEAKPGWLARLLGLKRVRDHAARAALLDDEARENGKAIEAARLALRRAKECEEAAGEAVRRARRHEAEAKAVSEIATRALQAAAVALLSQDSDLHRRLALILGDGNALAALHGEVSAETDSAIRSYDATALSRAQTNERLAAVRRELSACNARLATGKEVVEAAEAKLAPLREQKQVMDEAWWSLSDEERQKSSPWMTKEMVDARVRVFLAALALHRAFIIAAWKEGLSGNLNLAIDTLQGTAPTEAKSHLVDIWASLFLVVPVVSTTFASFGRLFRGLGRGSIGWLFVDEAGQAVPQAAVGALWRARRAVIIGDPVQIEPVVTMPASVIALLREKFKVPHGYAPNDVSAQGLADEANPLGGKIPSTSTWVGAPLRVHRRCDDPMFKVANIIAYDKLMVHGRGAKTGFPAPFGDSQWVHVAEGGGGGHWIEAEGRLAFRMVSRIRECGACSVYVISPFRAVAEGFRDLMGEDGSKETETWAKDNCGTVHTFQGKEADVVIFLLGSDPSVQGARKWAAEKPNLLNVALTRAKERVYVIGNRDLWSDQQYFDLMAEKLPWTTRAEFERVWFEAGGPRPVRRRPFSFVVPS